MITFHSLYFALIDIQYANDARVRKEYFENVRYPASSSIKSRLPSSGVNGKRPACNAKTDVSPRLPREIPSSGKIQRLADESRALAHFGKTFDGKLLLLLAKFDFELSTRVLSLIITRRYAFTRVGALSLCLLLEISLKCRSQLKNARATTQNNVPRRANTRA